jgi:predicted hotdog family 3-hydroxylacyl-ACP dehydratase
MCLLERVIDWDDTMIECLTRDAAADSHPLRLAGQLHAVVAAEYAAQATAVHGALRQPDAVRRDGRVAGIRELVWQQPDIADCLPVRVRCREQMRQPQAIVYEFELVATHTPVVTGQVTVAFPEETS